VNQISANRLSWTILYLGIFAFMNRALALLVAVFISLNSFSQADSTQIKKVDAMISRFYDLSYDKPDAAILLLDSAGILAKNIGYALGTNEVIRQRGLFYTERAQYVKSLGILLNALKEDEKIKNDDGIATDLLYIGLCFFDQEKLEEASHYMNQALEKYTSMHDEAGIALINANLGMVYRNMNRFDEALRCYESVRDFYIKDHNEKNLARVENNIGNVYKDQGLFDKALEHFIISKDLKVKENDQYGLVIAFSNIGDVYADKYQFDKAFGMYEQALTLAREQKSLSLEKDVYSDLSDAFAKKGDHKSALECYKKSMQLKDSIISDKFNSDLADMKVKYESEKTEKENSVLKNKSELQEIRLTEEKKQKILFASLFAIVFIAVLAVFVQYRNKKKLNAELARTNQKINNQNITLRTLNTELIESEQNLSLANSTKDQLLAMISHDLYNPVTNVINYTRDVKDKAGSFTKEEMQDAFQKINSGVVPLRDLLDNILQWARSQKQEIVPVIEKVKVSEAVKDILDLYQPAASFKKVKIAARGVNVPDIYTDRLMLYFVLRNLVNNAVKFSPSGSEVTISCLVLQGTLEVIVSDKGSGFSKEIQEKLNRSEEIVSTHGSGIGLAISRKFIKALKGEIHFENGPSGGAKVMFRIPGQANHA
jgi:signal transduction histidine kinase/tetratricopeptide (TPR) repeat protein